MCGIVGFIDKSPLYDPGVIAEKMGKAILTRGPDSSGIWQDENYGINLIHRRLAILDLTTAGHQPMTSSSGRYVMVFNGEVYNFSKLRKELDAMLEVISWRGNSDSEVILQGFVTWGIELTLSKMEGMFAIALWDRDTQDLYLIRDRIGEKPLYYGYLGGCFVFASELKALKCHPKFEGEINRNALSQLTLHNCIPAPLSIYEGIYKLEPGKFIKLSYASSKSRIIPSAQSYWNFKDSLSRKYKGTLDDAVLDLEKLLRDVIKEQMVADVPLGCFLSGGVDSSLIASLMQSQSQSAIKTFCIGFDNAEYDESNYALDVAKYLGTDHTALCISDKMALDVIPQLASIYDEPFSDSSQIPTYLVCKLAKTKVTVALSGDAGDELFAGYTRYLLTDTIRGKINRVPQFLREPIALLSDMFTPNMLAKINTIFKLPITNLSDKTYKLSSMMRSRSFDQFYIALTGHWLNHTELVLGSTNSRSVWLKDHPPLDNVGVMQYLDTLGYLPDDILTKVDRAGMANSLETRVPFLNHRVVEFANSLATEYKLNAGVTKYPLREILYKYVPKTLIERPKKGFGIPLNQWIRGELRDWAQDLLNPHLLSQQGYFNVKLVEQKLKDHLSGRANNGFFLWDVLMFQQWLYSEKNS